MKKFYFVKTKCERKRKYVEYTLHSGMKFADIFNNIFNIPNLKNDFANLFLYSFKKKFSLKCFNFI